MGFLRFVTGLQAHGVPPEKINYVICSHGHSDHVGNLNLFQSAVHIVSFDICKGDQYIMHDFEQVTILGFSPFPPLSQSQFSLFANAF